MTSGADAVPAPRLSSLWRPYRTELLLFAAAFLALACFSGPRFLRQSAAPHFIYQAKGFLDGRIDLDPQTLPNIEDWACVRQEGSARTRCTGAVRATDRWFVSFPAFPAVVMLPFVAVVHLKFNDVLFTAIWAAFNPLLLFLLLRRLKARG